MISIVLLNYNWKQFNKSCINSVLTQSYQDFEIIFVDQCSNDWSLEEVENIYQKEIKNWIIKIVKNYINNWFSWGNNLWAKHADKNSKYICLLNNDTTVPKNWLEVMINKIDNNKDLWAISCIIYDKWSETKTKNQIYVKKKKQVSTIFWESVFSKMEQEEIDESLYYTTILSWCCFMYRKNIIKEPFPEYYFAYAEDVFLGRYIINLWYKLWVALDTYVNHYGSWSFWTKPSKLKLFHWNKNQIINYLVFYPWYYKILLFPLFLIKEFAHLFMGSPIMRLKAKIEWWRRIIKNYNSIIITREWVMKNKTISSYVFILQQKFQLSDPFLMKNTFLKWLLFLWNVIFSIYGYIVKSFLYIVNLLI